ncbi:MAG: sensor histidine kinase [Geobacteraceae bacterium]|nr:sensor histidine kinase [Geobacteraceae bacterium]
MTISNGLFAVINDKRQVISLNDSFLKLMGIENVKEALGLRPGEYVKCIHACEMPAGCGTSEYCSTCGAVLSIIAAMDTRKPQDQTCALTIEKDNQNLDLYFSVRSCPIYVEDKVFVLLFLQDISIQQYRACLESSFFHDINNILCALTMKSGLLATKQQAPQEKLQELAIIVQRVVQEVSIQNNMMKSIEPNYQPLYSEVSVNNLLREVELVFQEHPLTLMRNVEVAFPTYDLRLTTDFHLTCRIIVNMVTNALEATREGGTVRVFTEPGANTVTLCVWNEGCIPEEIRRRIFQRNFSTKGTIGRGFGTSSMKLFGEKILGGRITFETSEEAGTFFRFAQIYP